MLPVTQALSGKAVLQGISPLAGRVGEQVFDPAFSLADDPLCAGRAASRPVDDECVASRVMRLVERGVVRRFIYDLETAARAKARSTGHGQRGIFGKPVPAYTNIVLGDVEAQHAAPLQLGGGLLAGITDGLLVDELIGVGQGNVIGGAFSHPVALAYRVERGEISGRVKDAAVAGNAYELWKRVGGFGSDARWTGSRWATSVLRDADPVEQHRRRPARSRPARVARERRALDGISLCDFVAARRYPRSAAPPRSCELVAGARRSAVTVGQVDGRT